MFFNGRKVNPADLDKLLNIDTKAYPFPWSKSEWEGALNALEIRIYRIEQKEVGFWVGRVSTEEEVEDNKQLKSCYHLLKLAVTPEYQKRGFGTAMTADVCKQARQWGKERVVTYVPEYLLDPDYPEYIGGWLAHPGVGFKPTGKIDHNVLYRYCRHWDSFEYILEKLP